LGWIGSESSKKPKRPRTSSQRVVTQYDYAGWTIRTTVSDGGNFRCTATNSDGRKHRSKSYDRQVDAEYSCEMYAATH
jgi:hypothetical protein